MSEMRNIAHHARFGIDYEEALLVVNPVTQWRTIALPQAIGTGG